MRNQFLKLGSLSTLSLLLLFACSKNQEGDQRVEERAAIEQEQQTKVEQQAINQRALEMEKDLKSRLRFFNAVKGTFEGRFQLAGLDFQMRMKLVPTVTPFTTERIRTIEEITKDLNSLSLKAQVIIWNSKSEITSVGCVFEEIRPDLQSGEIVLIGKDCPNLFVLKLAHGTTNEDVGHEVKTPPFLASEALSGSLDQIPALDLLMQSNNNSNMRTLQLKRVIQP